MWGNWQGWTISALIVALFAGTMFFINTTSVPTAPTAFSSKEDNFAPIDFPSPPAIVPTTTHAGEERSAAPDSLQKAIQLVKDNPTFYETFAQSGKLDSPDASKLDAITLLVDATSPNSKVFAAEPTQVITYAHAKPAFDALQLLGKITIDRLGLLSARAGKHDDAMKYYRAGLNLGLALSSERLTYDEYQLGAELLSKASAAMASLAEQTGHPEDAVALRDYDARRSKENELHSDAVLRLVRNINANTVGPHAGDLFELAKRSRERMWRVEAILALGRMRYFAGAGGTAANQRAANALLHDLATNDPDPIIRTAATAARDLTIEEYRMQ